MASDKPGPVPKEALDYFRAKGLKTSFDHREVYGAVHATQFTVAKAMQLDVLTSIREELDKALSQGQTFAQFKADLQPTLERLGWWGRRDAVDPLTGEEREVQLGSPRRLKTIYDSNLRSARAAGQWARVERTKRLRPYLMYELGPSEEHRPEHVQWAGLILPADDPFWQTHYPPNGYGCKCRVRQLSKAEAERRGGPGVAPPIERRPWVNKRTGEYVEVPKGIDPGWEHNPGASANDRHSARVFGTKVSVAPAALGAASMSHAAAFMRDALADDYKQWARALYRRQRTAGGEIRLVAAMTPATLNALAERGLSLQTAGITLQDRDLRHLARPAKHLRNQVLPEDRVLDLPNALAKPDAILRDRRDDSLLYVTRMPDGRLSKVVIKPGLTDKARLDGQRAKVQTNAIRTATVVERSNLPPSRYEVIEGKL